jgi:hypothetical protein
LGGGGACAVNDPNKDKMVPCLVFKFEEQCASFQFEIALRNESARRIFKIYAILKKPMFAI